MREIPKLPVLPFCCGPLSFLKIFFLYFIEYVATLGGFKRGTELSRIFRFENSMPATAFFNRFYIKQKKNKKNNQLTVLLTNYFQPNIQKLKF